MSVATLLTPAVAADLAPEARDAFRREQLTQCTMPIVVALVDGGFVGVLADKVFRVHPVVLALLTAAPMFGNLLSFLWARLAHGRRKVPIVAALQGGTIALVAAIALLPATGAGTLGLAVCVVGARLAISAIITVRSAVWSVNYPRMFRGRLVARLVLIATTTVMLTSVLGGLALDGHPQIFRVMYPFGAALALLGMVSYAGVRIAGEAEQLALERPAADAGHDIGAVTLLRKDPFFSRYLACQFVLGVGNMMIEAPLIYVVSRRLEASYFVSVVLMTSIPMLLAMTTTPLWGQYLDRVHVAEFRARASVLWIGCHLATWFGALTGSLVWIGVGRTLLGLARGGGRVAWQLGHNDFAEPRYVHLYMGIHATLTGVRGAFAPFAGMLLLTGWSAVRVPGVGLHVPSFAGIGPSVFLVAAACSTAAGLGFAALHRRIAATPGPTVR